MTTPDGASEGKPNEEVQPEQQQGDDFQTMMNRSRAWIDQLTEILRTSSGDEPKSEKVLTMSRTFFLSAAQPASFNDWSV